MCIPSWEDQGWPRAVALAAVRWWRKGLQISVAALPDQPRPWPRKMGQNSRRLEDRSGDVLESPEKNSGDLYPDASLEVM